MRSKIKAMSYGLAYGLSRVRAVAPADASRSDEAQGLMTEYFERFGGVRDYLHGHRRRRRGAPGYTETILGRRRYLPDLTSDNRQRREMAERMALNAPIQGSAADIIKVAMLRVDEALRERGLRSRGCCCRCTTSSSSRSPPGELEQAESTRPDGDGGAAELSVPLDVSVGVGSLLARGRPLTPGLTPSACGPRR